MQSLNLRNRVVHSLRGSSTVGRILIFHGGAVEHHPHVYVTYWGTEWQTGFHTGPNTAYSNKTAMNYVTNFFANVGGSAWNGTQTQYCDNIAVGSTSCAGQPLAQYIANTAKVLARVWIDFHPANITISRYYYAVQPMWSNEANAGAGGCAMRRGTGPAPVPSPVP